MPGRCGEEKNLAPTGYRTPAAQHVPILTEQNKIENEVIPIGSGLGRDIELLVS
jgi:hypothetical protein